MMVTGDVLGWGSGESSQRRGHSDYEKLLGKGILAVGTGSAKLPKKGHVRCIGEEERRPGRSKHDGRQGAQGHEIRLETQ